jgi:tRNA threonylcarbamoyladenosine biosynthesis protein TsaB
VLAEVSLTARGASETLLPAIHAALDLAGEDLGSVGRVLAGVGPGTFTGIRIAAATARALSAGTGIPLSKNSTLDALAAPARSYSGDVLAVLDARRGQVFARRYSEDGPTTGIYCLTPEELSVEGGPLVVGDGAVRYRGALSGLGRIPPEDSPLHRVTAVGHVISADLSPVSPDELVPIYVREPDAEVRRDLNPWSHP